MSKLNLPDELDELYRATIKAEHNNIQNWWSQHNLRPKGEYLYHHAEKDVCRYIEKSGWLRLGDVRGCDDKSEGRRGVRKTINVLKRAKKQYPVAHDVFDGIIAELKSSFSGPSGRVWLFCMAPEDVTKKRFNGSGFNSPLLAASPYLAQQIFGAWL